MSNIHWPREIHAAEIKHDEHEVSGTYLLSELATVPRWEGDEERDREWQKYVDADVFESAERYYKGEISKLRAALSMTREGVATDEAMRLQGCSI